MLEKRATCCGEGGYPAHRAAYPTQCPAESFGATIASTTPYDSNECGVGYATRREEFPPYPPSSSSAIVSPFTEDGTIPQALPDTGEAVCSVRLAHHALESSP